MLCQNLLQLKHKNDRLDLLSILHKLISWMVIAEVRTFLYFFARSQSPPV